MKEAVSLAKEADAKKGVSPTKSSDSSIHRAQNEPERQLGSLRGVIGNIRRDGGTPSVDSIATELSGMHTVQRAPVLLALQQTHGNRYVQRVVSSEAKVQRQVEEEEGEESLQIKKMESTTPELTDDLKSQIPAIRGGGQPLPKSERGFFEPRFGADFSGVRVHSDSKANQLARSINAKAFTIGQDVVFGSGQYSPGSRMGRSLLAHEMTHVVQQSSAKTKGNSSSVIRREQASTPTSTPTYITDIFVDLSTQAVSWEYSDGTRSASHLTSTGAGICQNDRSVCHSGNNRGTACTPVGTYPVTDNRSPHRYRHFIDFGRPSIGFHYYSDVDGCPWSHGCVRLRQNAIDLLHSGVVTVRQARTRPGVTATQVRVDGQPDIVRCWTTASGGSCYIRNATGRGQTRQRCARNDCFPMGDFPIPDMSDQATRYA
jgi:hypothetical protein